MQTSLYDDAYQYISAWRGARDAYLGERGVVALSRMAKPTHAERLADARYVPLLYWIVCPRTPARALLLYVGREADADR